MAKPDNPGSKGARQKKVMQFDPKATKEAYSESLYFVSKRLVDRVFIVLFARTRRELGDANLGAAWERAFQRLVRILVFPLLAAVGVGIVLTSAAFGRVPRFFGIGVWQLLAAAAYLFGYALLRRRYQNYLTSPPALPVEECPKDTKSVARFRLISIGSAVVALAVAAIHGLART